MLVSYEVHTYENGAWQITSMFSERELALVEARKMEEGLRRRETRVVEESHDEASGRTRSKTIYTTPKVRSDQEAPAKPAAPPPAKKPAARTKQPPAPQRSGRRAAPRPAKQEPRLGMIVLTFVAILGLGVGGLILLRYLSSLG